MENIIDLIATDASPAEISDAIKASLFGKAAERIDGARPYVAASLFGLDGEQEVDQESQEDQE
jgi:hypothetical protein